MSVEFHSRLTAQSKSNFLDYLISSDLSLFLRPDRSLVVSLRHVLSPWAHVRSSSLHVPPTFSKAVLQSTKILGQTKFFGKW